MSDRAIPIDGRSYQVDGRAVARRAIPDSVVYPVSDDDTHFSDIRGSNTITIDNTSPVLITELNDLSLKFSTSSNQNVSGSTSGLDNYPSSGDSFTYYQHNNGGDPQHANLFALQGGDDGGYGVRFDPRSPLLRLFRADEDWTDRTTLASESPSGLDSTTWFGIRVNWGSSGTIEVELKSVDQTTGDVTGNITTISASDSTYSSGGVGFFSGSDTSDNAVIDFWTIGSEFK